MLWSRPADACSLPRLDTHQVNAAGAQTDRQPPVLDSTTGAQVSRSEGEHVSCDGTVGSSSCGDLGSVLITVAARDDQTPAAQLGYRLRVVAGTPPPGLVVPSQDVRALSNLLPLHFSDDDRGRAFSFTLTVAPIDAAGNVGTALPLVIGDAGSGGCGFAPSLPGSAPGATVLAFALLVLRRWRSRRRDCL